MSDATERTTRTELAEHVEGLARAFDTGEVFADPVDEDEDAAFDYLEKGVLDIEWIIASDKETVLGARLLVAFGGPNIWIDTRRGVVEGFWWGDHATADFRTDSDSAEALAEALETVWGC